MNDQVVIAAAGNVLPAALESLRALGYSVSVTESGGLCKAQKGNVSLIAEEPLMLLGLVKLYEVRGAQWHPSEEEQNRFLSFEAGNPQSKPERVDVWEERGAVHVLCVSSHGDPVELSEEEASEFASRLGKAIECASGGNG
jgi:hypothetical protein